MPRMKTTYGRIKSVSCPRCGKKFCTETNVLQHMNQPTGSCYSGSIPLFDEQAILAAQANRAPGSSSADQGEVEPPEILDEDVEMNEFASNHSGDPSDLEPLQFGVGQLRPGRYVETFEGCGETFPGGRTFMDGFWADEYAEQRRENIYYPWASKDEWAFTSCSH